MSGQNRQQKRAAERSQGKHSGAQVSFPRVKVAIPFYRNVGQTASTLMSQIARFGIPGYDTHLDSKPSCFIHLIRTEMASRDDFDYIFFIDDDVGFESSKIHAMVETKYKGQIFPVPIMIACMKQILDQKLDICGGIYVNRTEPFGPQVYEKGPTGRYVGMLDIPKKGVEEVDAIATGFLCIKREVIQKMKEDFATKVEYKRRYDWWLEKKPEEWEALPDHVKTFLGIAKATLYPPFWMDNVWDETKQRFTPIGEDIYFCREAARLGFKIHADYAVRLGHEASIYVTPETFEENYQGRAIAERALWEKKLSEISIEPKKKKGNTKNLATGGCRSGKTVTKDEVPVG